MEQKNGLIAYLNEFKKIVKIKIYLNRELVFKIENCEQISVQEMADNIFVAIEQTFGGEFYCKIYDNKSGNAEPYIHRFEYTPKRTPYPGAMTAPGIFPAVDIESLKKQIRNEILFEDKEKELKELEAELNEKDKQLDSFSGKFFVLLEKIGMRIIEAHGPKLESILNGFIDTPKTSLNLNNTPMSESNTAPAEYTQEQIDSVNNSLQAILTVFTPDEFKRLADYIKKNPNKKSLILGFV